MAKRFTNCGLELPKNLFLDPRKKKNIWRYKMPDFSFKQIKGSAEKAMKIANEANRIRAESSRVPYSFHWFREKYIKWREENAPFLMNKVSWRNRQGTLYSFCEEFSHLKPKDVIKVKQFKGWWGALTYDQQHNRRAELSKFFQYLITEEALTINPFTTADDKPRLTEKGKPKKSRMPMTLDDFWKIYNAAGSLDLECVQLFMGYALITDLRESDILKLRFDEHVKDDRLELTIGKSLQQRGAIQASHHCWTFSNHPIVKHLVNHSRELSLMNQCCPYLISYRPETRRISKIKEHKFQLLPRQLIALFSKARDASKVYKNIPANRMPATLHEIKGLSLHIAKEAGEDITELQQLAAHTNIRVTQAYMAEHKPSFKEVGVVFTKDMIKGDLR